MTAPRPGERPEEDYSALSICRTHGRDRCDRCAFALDSATTPADRLLRTHTSVEIIPPAPAAPEVGMGDTEDEAWECLRGDALADVRLSGMAVEHDRRTLARTEQRAANAAARLYRIETAIADRPAPTPEKE